jgi:general secretion pathway protein F
MGVFEIRAIRQDGSLTALMLDAATSQAAEASARQQGLTVIGVKQARSLAGRRRSEGKNFPLALFSQELLTLLEAGLPVVEAVETLKEKESKPERQRLLELLVKNLYEGMSFSQSLEAVGSVFPSLYVATVRASEKSGDLQEALSRYVAYQAQLDTVKKKIVSAAIYPALLGGAGLLVIIFLLSYVVPRFAKIFEDIGGDIPLMSRLLIQWGRLVRDHGGSLALGIISFLALAGFWLSRPATRAMLVQRLMQISTIGENFRIYQLARFYRTLGMLLRSGMSIMTAFSMTEGLLHGSLRLRLREASEKVRQGTPISVAMEAYDLTTPVSLRMLRVGERSGRMGEMMERIAAFYDEEISRWVDWFIRLFEPLLMVFIGVIIGVIVVMMYFPIFELAGSLQ